MKMRHLIAVALLCAPLQAYAGDRLLEINVHDNARGRVLKVGVGDHVVLPYIGEGYVIEVTLTGTEKIQLLDGKIIPMPALAVAYMVADAARVDQYWEQKGETAADVMAQADRDREARQRHQ